MLINLRNAMMAGRRLPYDAELEYLESTGTQWIDTGVSGLNSLVISISAKTDMKAVNYVFGCIGADGQSTAQRLITATQSGVSYLILQRAQFGIGGRKRILLDDDWHDYYLSSSVATIDGVSASSANISADVTDNTLGLFGYYNLPSDSYYLGTCAIRRCQLWLGGILVRDFIPVRRGTVGYLYDRVTRRLFGNAGTGDFVLGPDVVPVEWLESDGTEWVNTGCNADSNLSVEITMANAGTPINNVNPIGSILMTPLCRHHLNFSSSGVTYYFGNGDSSRAYSTFVPTDGEIFTFKVDAISKTFTLGSSLGTFLGDTFDTGLSYWLFGRNGTTPPSLGSLRIYSAKLWNGTTHVRSFRPVRVGTGSTWEGAMMDVLTRRIYRNAGTGAFSYGNDLKYPIPAA